MKTNILGAKVSVFQQDQINYHRKGMYNGAILGVPHRINDEVEERELIREGLSSLI